MNENRSPLRIYCKNCGAPANFDIVNQTYRCPNCGMSTGIEEAYDSVYKWKELNKNSIKIRAAGDKMEECSCSACGAIVIFGEGEASEKCIFCGSKLVRSELTDSSQMPDLIIPFTITPEEAKKRMLDWGHKHSNTPEGKAVVSSMGQFHGSYLPYRVAKGPVYAEVLRDGNDRRYQCGGYLDGTAVNTSKQFDNLVMNEMEPFDWSAARPFEFGLIAGMPVKLNDSPDKVINQRIEEEVTEDFRPKVESVMQTSGVQINTHTEKINVLSAILPVYFIKNGPLTAVMNGQTGRIAVSKNRTTKSYPWMIEPTIYTVILTLIMGYFYGWAAEPMFYGAMVFGCIIFAVMCDGRTSLIRRVTLKSEASKAYREDGELVINEEKGILKNPYSNIPVFYEANAKGERVPVRLKFYTFGRWVGIIINALVTIFLPLIPATLLRLADMEEGEGFFDHFYPMNGAAWYVLAAMIVLVYFVKGVRKDVYDHPYIYELRPDGRQKLIGKRIDRKLSILSMFGIGRMDRNGKRITLLGTMKDMGCSGFGLLIGLFFILLGSTCAIVF